MPLYLVRWPALSASLVQADNEDDLLDMLDQVADPGGCTFEVYSGPLWIDFDLPFQIRDARPKEQAPTDASAFIVEPTPEFSGEICPEMMSVSVPPCDASSDMLSEVVRGAFPDLALFMEDLELDGDGNGDTDTDADADADADDPQALSEGLSTALRDELWLFVRFVMAQSELAKRDDLEARIMKAARVTCLLPAMRRALAEALETAPARRAD